MRPELISFPLHPSGLPHAETFGLPPAVQWGVAGAFLLTAVWLAADARGRLGAARGRPLFDDDGGAADGPLVVGRRADGASPQPGLAEKGDVSIPSKTSGTTRWMTPVWWNPIRVLTAVLGVGAGVFALDRARAIMALDAMLGTDGTLQVSRLAVGLTVLFCVGGALAMPAPRVAAAVFLGAAGLAGFFALAGEWEARLRWWGAEYALTAWEDLWVWAGIGVGLAVLAYAGGWYSRRGGVSGSE